MIKQRGFTLIELLVFVVAVGLGLAGILSVMNTVVAASADPLVRKQTLSVAQSLLEEILLKDYAKPAGSTVEGFSAGGSRALFDCVDDYHNYTANPATDVLGVSVAGLANYRISPGVVVAATADLAGVVAKKITVSVSGPGGTVRLSGYRSDY